MVTTSLVTLPAVLVDVVDHQEQATGRSQVLQASARASPL
jgi:hypothetical protein